MQVKSEEFNIGPTVAFLCGVIAKEIINFVNEGGLTGHYPLSKSLFLMLMATLLLLLLMFQQFKKMKSDMESFDNRMDGMDGNVNNLLKSLKN